MFIPLYTVLLLTMLSFIGATTVHPKTFVTTMELCNRSGYPIEEHENVETPDGYLLSLHRIPHGKKNSRKEKKPVVLMMHGLFCNSAVFASIEEKSLAFVLAEAGYDVWMGNARGNEYSRKHVDLNPDIHPEFWKFSWHEIGVIDIPTMIDYVLHVTKQEKLYFVGHSQGTTSFFVMSSERREYNKKIQLMIALAPIAYMGNVANVMLQLVAPFSGLIACTVKLLGMYELLPSNFLLHKLGRAICEDHSPIQAVCSSMLFLSFGWDSQQFNKTLLPLILSTYPSGSSWMQLVHYLQLVDSGDLERTCETLEYRFLFAGEFHQYDYGYWGNYRKYGSMHPPVYDTYNMSAPIAIYYSANDLVAAIVDVNRLVGELPNLVEKYLVPLKEFNHVDFLYAIDVKKLVYDPVLELLKKYPIAITA